MSVIVVFMAAIAIMAGWWLLHQGLGIKPWLEQGEIGGGMKTQPAKVGLAFFLAVVGALFALVISAYSMRMTVADWRQMPLPALIWFNTGVLVLSSAALQWAKVATRRADNDGVMIGVLAADASALIFLLGQLLVWRQLVVAGYFAAANPANAFFYLITAVHGLHLIGGLVALNKIVAQAYGAKKAYGAKAWRGATAMQLRLSVELCATYWHFLLLVWLILLGLLSGWASDFITICRQLIF